MSRTRTTVLLTDHRVWAAAYVRRSGRWALRHCAQAAARVPTALIRRTDLEALASPITEALNELERTDDPIRLVIPASWLFVHRVDVPAHKSASSAAYALEEFLPIPLEDVETAFLPAGDGKALGLAIAHAPLRALLDSLQANGFDVNQISVDALAALAGTGDDGPDGARLLVLVDSGHASLVAVDAAKQVLFLRTVRLPEDDDTCDVLAGQLRLTLSQNEFQPAAVTVVGNRSEDWLQRIASMCDTESARILAWNGDHPPEVLLAPHDSERLAAADFCKGELGYGGRFETTRRRAALAFAGAALWALVIAGGFAVRSQETLRATDELLAQQREVFGRVSPDQSFGPGANLQLASQRKRLEGLTRPVEPGSPDSEAADPLEVLRGIVGSLDERTRVLVQDLRIDAREVSLRGKTTGHAQAESIARRLSRIAGLDVRPPRSDAIKDGGVNFTIRAERDGGANDEG